MLTYIEQIKNKILSGMLMEMFREAKWITQYMKKYWKAILYYISLGIVGTVMGLVGSVASKYLIDAVTGHDTGNIFFIIAVILCMAFGNIAAGAAANRVSIRISLKVNNELLAEAYHQIMNTDWESISGYHSGDLLNRLSEDVEIIAGSVLGFIPSLITRLVQFIGTLIIIMYYDPTMAFIALVSAPISVAMSKMLMLRMRDYNQKMRKISSEMTAFSEESFQNIQVIKCFDLLKLFGQRLKQIQGNYIGMALDYNKFSIITSVFLSVIGLIISYATFGWGVYRLWGGFITYGTMTLFLQLSSGLSGAFSALISLVPSAISATTSAGRIIAIVELPRERYESTTGMKFPEPHVENHGLTVFISHLDFNYQGRVKVLQDVSFYVRPKELIAIIGPSGEGKTTLLRILLGLISPTAGEVTCIDEKGSEISISASTRRLFSYVPQENTIFSGTIADNLRMVKPEATEEELSAVLKTACAYDFVKELPEGINSIVGENGGGFSEGQLQRLSIARAILRDAPVLLLDEATSALDTCTEEKVLQGIMAYGKTHSCILTTHRKSVIAMCNRVYQIRGNEIVELSDRLLSGIAMDY